VTERSPRPYLIRALYEWAVDSGLTPQITVDVTVPGVAVPSGYDQDNLIVLNIHPRAVQELDLGLDTITFTARFGARSEWITVPVQAVRAILARENGRGIQFPATDDSDTPPPEPAPEEGASGGRKGTHLKIVK